MFAALKHRPHLDQNHPITAGTAHCCGCTRIGHCRPDGRLRDHTSGAVTLRKTAMDKSLKVVEVAQRMLDVADLLA